MITDREQTDTQSTDARLRALEQELETLKSQLQPQKQENQASIICFSGEWDRLFASLTIAVGSLAMGMEVHLFFTFWAASALRGNDRT